MKKYFSIFLMVVVALSFCGCNITRDMIGTKNGVAYFNKPENTPKITYTNVNQTQRKETKIDDPSFCDKLIAAIDGKPAGDDFCNCMGDYQVIIDNKYTFWLHTNKIVVISNTEEFTSFTVECSEKETKELYDILEAAN